MSDCIIEIERLKEYKNIISVQTMNKIINDTNNILKNQNISLISIEYDKLRTNFKGLAKTSIITYIEE